MVNLQKLKYLFPHASKGFLQLNSGLQDPVQQQVRRPTLEKKIRGKEKGNGRIDVLIVSYRSRLLDDDNLRGGAKELIDCLKVAGIIPDDSPRFIRLDVKQCKVEPKSETTIIKVTYP